MTAVKRLVQQRAQHDYPAIRAAVEVLVLQAQDQGWEDYHGHGGCWISWEAWRTIPLGQRVDERMRSEIVCGDVSRIIWNAWIEASREIGPSSTMAEAEYLQKVFASYREALLVLLDGRIGESDHDVAPG